MTGTQKPVPIRFENRYRLLIILLTITTHLKNDDNKKNILHNN